MVTVAATIADIGADTHDAQGERHQHLYVQITAVADNPDGADVQVGQRVQVAIHYGDAAGLPGPVPGLRVGEPITCRGRWVPLAQAYPSPDGEHLPVIHYTHHPLGWVLYQGTRYS